MENLPDYMKVCYLALINTTNEVAYEVLKKHDINALPYLTKSVTFIHSFYLIVNNFFSQNILEANSIFKWLLLISGQIYANHTYKKQDGTTTDTSQIWKNTWIMDGFQLQFQWY